MRLIAHRGNINGPDKDLENNPDQIHYALSKGYDVEIDVWLDEKDGLMLGHDAPQYFIDEAFLFDSRLWCHAKNLPALTYMQQYEEIHCFWHENDKHTLTSKGYIWTFPRKPLSFFSIAVYPELYPDGTDFSIAAGICSDHIKDYK